MSQLNYVAGCIKEHVEGMKYREEELRAEIRVKNEQLKLLESERKNLESGIENWLEESESV